MKKLICLCLLMLVVTGLCISVGATTGTEKAVLACSSGVQPGKTIAISVNLSGCGVANGYTVELIYDHSLFELVGGTWQPQDTPFGTEADVGTFTMAQPAAPNHQILTFTLRAAEDAKIGPMVDITCAVTLHTEEGDISVPVQGVTIQISCPHNFVKNETAEYRIELPTCTEPAKYVKSCSRCGARDDNQEFTSGKPLGHNFKDREFTEYLAEAGDCQNRNIYYVSCAACGLKGEQVFEGRTLGEHVFDNDCDAKCNICFTQRPVTHIPAEELSSNGKGHWHACTRCEGKVDMTPHTPGPEATPEAPQVCTDCGYVIAEYQAHVHEFAPEWVTDEENHWAECPCGEITALEPHSWDVMSPTLHRCPICGAEKKVDAPTEIGGAPPPPPSPSPKKARPSGR